MKGFVSCVGGYVNSYITWGSSQINQWIDGTIAKVSEMGKRVFEFTEGENSITNPFYWKKVLNASLQEDFKAACLDKKTVEQKSLWLDQKFNRYRNLVLKAAVGHIPLDPQFVLHEVYQHAKQSNPTFCALLLIELVIPMMGVDKRSKRSLFDSFLNILPKCDSDLVVALMVQFRMKVGGLDLNWWKENVSEKNFGHSKKLTHDFYEKLETKIKDLKHQAKKSRSKSQKIAMMPKFECTKKESGQAPIFLLKTAFIAALLFSQIGRAHAAVFDDKQFYNAVSKWNFTEGDFPVHLQLQKQLWCKSDELFCEIPPNLVPPAMKSLSHFYWHNLRINLNRASPLNFYKNTFEGTFGDFSGNFTFTGAKVHESHWELSNKSSMSFGVRSIFHDSSIIQGLGSSLLSFSDGEINGAWLGSRYTSEVFSDRSLMLSDVYVNSTQLSDISRIRIEDSLLESVMIAGNVSSLNARGSLLNKSTLNAHIDQGAMLESTLSEVDLGPHSISLIMKDCPVIQLQLFDLGQLVNSVFENINELKLIRDRKLLNEEDAIPFDNCVFRNITTMEIRFNKTRLFSPLLENVQLLTGSWKEGGFGSDYVCNQTEAVLKAKNVFADFIEFYAVDGGCNFEMTPEQAKEWFEKAGVRFGPHVKFNGYGSNSHFTPIQIATFVFGATAGTIWLISMIICCARTNCRRKEYASIPYESKDL